jgi:Ca2+/Na+ antiporter
METKYKRVFFCMELIAYWIGSTMMIVAPLFKIKTWIMLVIIGLIVLTHQAMSNELYNLVFLNVCSILIYAFRFNKEQIKEKITL